MDIFSEAWDIETIKMFKGNPTLYGDLTEEAKNVLTEYASYTTIAKNAVFSMIFEECKEKNVPTGYDGEFVKIRYTSGKLSFIRNGVEYYV